jgi:hypothetical protein
MPAKTTDNPHHWLERAAQMRALSAHIKDAEARTIMLQLAVDYEKLADRAKARTTKGNHARPEAVDASK